MVLAHFVWHLLTLRSGGQVEIVSDLTLLLVQELLLGCDEHLSAALVLHLEAGGGQVRTTFHTVHTVHLVHTLHTVHTVYMVHTVHTVHIVHIPNTPTTP
jgi:hypothetical protein